MSISNRFLQNLKDICFHITTSSVFKFNHSSDYFINFGKDFENGSSLP